MPYILILMFPPSQENTVPVPGLVQLTFCSPVWYPNLLKDIKFLERVQGRATKFILGNFKSTYKEHLLFLKLFPFMYYLEMNDVFFFLRRINDPPPNFNTLDYVLFCLNSTHSSSSNKLKHPQPSSGARKFFYFHCLPRLWNSSPPTDTSQPFN